MANLTSDCKNWKENERIKNFGFRTAHDVEILFDRELTKCDIVAENLFHFDTHSLVKLTVIWVEQYRSFQKYGDGVIISCCSDDRPAVLRITLDNGRAYQDAFCVKTFRPGMVGLIAAVKFTVATCSLVSYLVSRLSAKR